MTDREYARSDRQQPHWPAAATPQTAPANAPRTADDRQSPGFPPLTQQRTAADAPNDRDAMPAWPDTAASEQRSVDPVAPPARFPALAGTAAAAFNPSVHSSSGSGVSLSTSDTSLPPSGARPAGAGAQASGGSSAGHTASFSGPGSERSPWAAPAQSSGYPAPAPGGSGGTGGPAGSGGPGGGSSSGGFGSSTTTFGPSPTSYVPSRPGGTASFPAVAPQPATGAVPTTSVPYARPPYGSPYGAPYGGAAAPFTPYQPAQRPSGMGKRLGIAAGLLALTLTSAVAGGVAAVEFTSDSPAVTANRGSTSVTPIGSMADVVSKVSPSVVSINVTLRNGGGTGSGSVMDKNGNIMTNAHVVNGATRITVHFSDGRELPATLVGADTTQDVAVVKVSDTSNLTPAEFGKDSSVRVGDPVLAFGSPLGLDGSVSAGIVSAVNRQVEGRNSNLDGMLQTDAAINPGNSGGPLVNAAGQVIGMNTAIATTGESNGNIGLGFAIPMDRAQDVAKKIITG
ncbi:hypothetical protein Val02_39490 [Virgisporangium aliadipatigenens]|uniref:Trypsin-like serine protease n=1 Tax=Virgisporangium aliadipatigenens TaxID=741659 RepID=A0A8J3YNT5_9ACTN|nr:trypsin-like peptidase domain-containing protein [Virgisporangium aliadipatigenens]GIJ47063.1 hypothetical protein Val02_39490 [Virgisporangium aliadipatigenens]